MAGYRAKRRTHRTEKKTIGRAGGKKASGRKVAAKNSRTPRRTATTRSTRSSGAVVVLSGSTPLRRSKAAELVAEELQLDLTKADLSSVVSRYAGETEQNINRLFDEAERGGSILFFDGADALFGSQTAKQPGKSHYANAGAAHLLHRIQGHKGLVILTTNGKSKIDQALSRQTKVSVMVGIKQKRKAKKA
jgi:ATP-dependent 26S proteasome regulatory subunit